MPDSILSINQLGELTRKEPWEEEKEDQKNDGQGHRPLRLNLNHLQVRFTMEMMANRRGKMTWRTARCAIQM